jgi:predicted Fe-Mo cluster-binding NifX family protein
MKIAVTSQNFRSVTGHAGRARRFLVYDVPPSGEPVQIDQLDLPKELAMHDFQGPGPHPLDSVDVILTQGFGEGFARRMAMRGIKAVATEESDPLEAVKAYVARPADTPATCECAGEGDLHGHRQRHRHGGGRGHGQGSGGMRRGYRTLETVSPEAEKHDE